MVKFASPSINESIKMLAVDVINSTQPVSLLFGTVMSVNPLKIKVDQQEFLTEQSLILSNMVKDHDVDITVSMQTVEDAYMNPAHTHTGNMGSPTDTGTLDTTHKHDIKGRKKITFHYGLKTGEKVILLKKEGGHKYLVIDRVETPIVEGEWL